MLDIGEELSDCRFNVDLVERRADGPDEGASIIVGPTGRSEARHGHRHDMGSGKIQQVHRMHRHIERVGGILTAGHPDNHFSGIFRQGQEFGRQPG